jgi:hypothetical protein
LIKIKKQGGDLEARVEKNMKYQRYLDQVQEENAEEYPEITDLLNRYKVSWLLGGLYARY